MEVVVAEAVLQLRPGRTDIRPRVEERGDERVGAAAGAAAFGRPALELIFVEALPNDGAPKRRLDKRPAQLKPS